MPSGGLQMQPVNQAQQIMENEEVDAIMKSNKDVLYEHTRIWGPKYLLSSSTLCAKKISVRKPDGQWESRIYVGSSICSHKDQFTKRIGREIAGKRADGGLVQAEFFRPENQNYLYNFIFRCLRYFKNVPYENVRMESVEREYKR